MRTALGSALRNIGCSWGRADDVLSVDGRTEDGRSTEGRAGDCSREGLDDPLSIDGLGIRSSEGLEGLRSIDGRAGRGRCSY